MNNRLICRSYQLCSAAMLRLMPVKMKKLIRGSGSIVKAADILREDGISKVEIITTAGSVRRGMLDGLCRCLDEYGIAYVIFDKVRPDPDIGCIDEAASLFAAAGCEAVIAVGGGSALDCAKIAAAKAARPGMDIGKMKGLLKIHRKLPPVIAVPTTAGTGSEITAAAVVTDAENNFKFTIMDFCIVPAAAVLDPQLTLGLSPSMTAETGMDAFTHAVESYINLFSSQKVNEQALEAIKLIDENIESAVNDGDDLEAREKMLLGSYYAGLAFTNGYVGYVHAIAHAVGGIYHIPHGRACAVILPAVLTAYADADANTAKDAISRIKRIEQALDTDSLVDYIRLRNERMNIPQRFDFIRESDIDEIAARAEAEANPTYPVPVIMDRQQLADIVRSLISV